MNEALKTSSAISKKAWYALRALFELACRENTGPVKVQDISQKQNIPVRFLENILCELRQAGLVFSMQGKNGGYVLARPSEQIRIAEILHLCNGLPAFPPPMAEDCTVSGDRAFAQLWRQVETEVNKIYDSTTLAGLIEREHQEQNVLNYVI
ncbi:MAG: Rrf2 family transcriptional regulator [Sedimentisphaerales bacterium]|nr:Rrf2 family transcriptional regulator [Sedimentisphaerales bacterium]